MYSFVIRLNFFKIIIPLAINMIHKAKMETSYMTVKGNENDNIIILIFNFIELTY